MPAYVVIDVQSADPEKAAAYRELSGPSVGTHGGRFLVRGGEFDVLEGDWQPERVVVIEFATREAARAWYDSDDYRAARAVREGGGTWNMVVVDGL